MKKPSDKTEWCGGVQMTAPNKNQTALIHRLSAQCEQVARFAEIFRMPTNSMPPGLSTRWMRSSTRRCVAHQSNHDVTAEHHVKGSRNGQSSRMRLTLMNSIMAQLRGHGPCQHCRLAAQKKRCAPGSGPLRPSCRYTPRARLGQHTRIDIAGRQFERGTRCQASSAVMTMEYGSSPVDAALHQIFHGVAGACCSKCVKTSKWWCSRKTP